MAGASTTETSLVRFGIFEVDPRSGELRRNGAKVRLQEQPLQILLTLLGRPGQLVTRDELRTRLWPDDTFVDFDHSINTAVRRLRDALGDSAESPRFVETVARRGYRFLAPVQAPFSAAASLAPPVGVDLGWHAAQRVGDREGEANARGKDHDAGAIPSPDGRHLAIWKANGSSNVWMLEDF